MRNVREVLRLKWEAGLTLRQIARSCKLSRDTVTEYLNRAKAAGLTWPLPESVDDASLEARLFPGNIQRKDDRQAPDFGWIHQERRKNRHVTMQLLWIEYKKNSPKGYQYYVALGNWCKSPRTPKKLSQLLNK